MNAPTALPVSVPTFAIAFEIFLNLLSQHACTKKFWKFNKVLFPAAVVLDGHDGLPSVQWLADHLFEIFSDALDKEMIKGNGSLDRVGSDSGVFCPVNLSPVLIQSFHSADKELLKYLKGEQAVPLSCMLHFYVMKFMPSHT